MTITIPEHYVVQFQNNVAHLLQDQGNKFRPHVTVQTGYTGEGVRPVHNFGPTQARKSTGRNEDTPNMNVPREGRWVTPESAEWGFLFEKKDDIRMLIDPTSALVQSGVMAMLRLMDDDVSAAILGTAKIGKQGESTVDLPAGQTVGTDVGGVGTNMNVAKLQEAKFILRSNDVDLERVTDDEIWVGLTASQEKSLEQDIQIVDGDLSKAVKDSVGNLVAWNGFRFFHYQRFGKTGTVRDCPLWMKSGVVLGLWDDLSVAIKENTAKKFRPHIFMEQSYGATRVQEKKVVKIQCTEA